MSTGKSSWLDTLQPIRQAAAHTPRAFTLLVNRATSFHLAGLIGGFFRLSILRDLYLARVQVLCASS